MLGKGGCVAGGHVWWEVCAWQGGMDGRGQHVWQEVCMVRGI